MEKSFAWPDADGPSDALCPRCADLRLDTTPAYNSFSEKEIVSYGIRPFNWYRDDGLILAQDRIFNLSKTASCPLCQLIIAAVREQYRYTNESIASTHLYALLCRYVPLSYRKYGPSDTALIRYIEIVSPANCDFNAPTVTTKEFHIKDQMVSRDTLRSILVPATPSGSPPEYLKAKVLEDQIDFSLLVGWLHRCEKLHGETCTNTIGEVKEGLSSPSFMAINVKEMHLTTPPPKARYATLSYCWGPKGKNSFLTTASNISLLQDPGGLSRVWDELPATIQDAIVLAQKIGEKFLWIDSLCIVQDNAKSVKENIASMQRIYSESAVTIIAASGEDATSGLPGVRSATRGHRQQIRSLSPQCHYALVDDLELALTRCPWVKRGWTYQEWFLSPKCLVFINGYVVFSCYQDTWREDIAADAPRPILAAESSRPLVAEVSKDNHTTPKSEQKRHGFLHRMFHKGGKKSGNIALNNTTENTSMVTSIQDRKKSKVGPQKPKFQEIPLNNVDFSYIAVGYELRPSRRRGLTTDFDREPMAAFMMTLRDYWQRELRYAEDRLNAYQGIIDYYATIYGTTSVAGTLAMFSDWAMVLHTHGERRAAFPSWSWSGWSGEPTWLLQNDVFEWMNYNCWIVWHYRGQDPETITSVKRSLTVEYDAKSPITAESLKVSDEEDWKDLDSVSATLEWLIFKNRWKREATPTRLPDGPLSTAAISAARGFAQFWTIVLPVTFKGPLSIGEAKLFDREGVECGEIAVNQTDVASTTPELFEVIALSEVNWQRGVKWAYVDKHKQGSRARSFDDVFDGKLNVMLIGWTHGIAERMGIGTVWKEVITYSPKREIVWKEIVLA